MLLLTTQATWSDPDVCARVIAFFFMHSQKWGFEIKYKEVALLPNLAIKHFALETPDGRMTVKNWKDITFTVDDFNFEEYCREHFPDLFD